VGDIFSPRYISLTYDGDSIVNISVIADPQFELGEINYDDNFKHRYIKVNAFTEGNCKKQLKKAC
jgi:hypothetical protein